MTASYIRQDIVPCLPCNVYDDPGHYQTSAHRERLQALVLGAPQPVMTPAMAKCHCCHVPTPLRGMCLGCKQIHGYKLSPKDADGKPTCPRALLADEGDAEHFAALPPTPGRKAQPSREAYEHAASFEVGWASREPRDR